MKKHVHSHCVHPPFRAHPRLCGFFVALTVLLTGCEHQTGRAGGFSITSEDGPPRIWYWETRESAPIVGSQPCEPDKPGTGEERYTCRVPILQGSSDAPVILAVGEGVAFEAKLWDFPDEWEPPSWPFQLEHPGNTVGDIHLSRTEDMHQQVLPLNEIQWRLAWDAEDPPPLEAWVVFRVATSAGGDQLEVALYYDGGREQPWREAGGEGESPESLCAGQRSGGGTDDVPCYLPAPPPGEAYQVEVWLRGAERAVEEAISLSRTELVPDSETRLRCPGEGEDSYTLYYPDTNEDGDGDPSGAAVAACDALDGYVANAEDCEGEVCESPTPPPSEWTPTPIPAFPSTPAPDDVDQDSFSPAQGDCNDDDPLVHPGAEDPSDDGVDQDCGGLDGPQPHVGLNEQSATSIQAALDASPDDPAVTVWVGPGTYYEYEVTFRGKALRLKSTQGQGKTVIDAEQRGWGMVFDSEETGREEVDGFTVTGGLGGIFVSYSNVSLTRMTLTGNSAYVGGGMWLQVCSPILTQVTLDGNSADLDGGGMYLSYSSPILTQVTLTGNVAGGRGGGMYLSDSSPSLTQVTLTGNVAGDSGAMALQHSSPTLTHVTLTGNEAIGDYGVGGMGLEFSSPSLHNSILAFNSGLALFAGNYSLPTITYSNLYNPYGPSHNLPSLPLTVTEVAPGFVTFSADGNPSNDDLHLRPGSLLIDGGDPSTCTTSSTSGCDPDGSIADLGAFGGANADFSYYADVDFDGLYDGWEEAHSGSLITLDGNNDGDADGLTDDGELSVGTNPSQADSDGDGFLDGAEITIGRDPLNPFSVPGVEGLVVLEVPSSAYPTVQAALNAIPALKHGHVRLAAGTFKENLLLYQKRVTLEGAGEGLTLLDGQQKGSVLTVDTSAVELNRLTLKNGKALRGGGADFKYASGSLTQVTLTENSANFGGGISMWYSSPTLTHLTLTGNSANSGGGMYLWNSSPTLAYVMLTGNSAYYYGDGGGMYLYQSSPSLTEVALIGNSANFGGGMNLQYSFPALTQVTITGNAALYYGNGGGVYLHYSSPILHNSIVAYNQASDGGNLYQYSSSTLTANSSLFYTPPSFATDTLSPTGTYLTVEPHFLSYAYPNGTPCTPGSSLSCLPSDLHLALDSPLINAGDPSLLDPDGSRSDIGSYGGPGGNAWDVDGDGLPDYFWPGTWYDAPEGFESTDYDCDDLDPMVGGCP